MAHLLFWIRTGSSEPGLSEGVKSGVSQSLLAAHAATRLFLFSSCVLPSPKSNIFPAWAIGNLMTTLLGL